MTIQIILLSSLEKVFPDEAPHANPFRQASALLGERFSFQIACFMEGADKLEVAAAVATDPSLPAELYEVGVVPATFPVAQLHDEDYLRTAPGLFPDPLYPHKGAFSIPHHQWRNKTGSTRYKHCLSVQFYIIWQHGQSLLKISRV